MERKKIKKDGIRQWLDRIAERYRLIAPVQRNVVQFSEVNSGNDVVLDSANSVLPPKGFFLPQTEVLFAYRNEAGEVEVTRQEGLEGERVMFGVRQCDVRSLVLLDEVFRGEFEDLPYSQRREKTTVVGVTCTEPQDTCFCLSFSVDPFSSEGTDMLLTDLGEEYLVDVHTQTGAGLVGLSPELFARVLPHDEKRALDLRAEALHRIADIGLDGIEEKLDSMWDEAIWSDLGEVCIGCGVCTYLCPTCHCFDIQDDGRGREGMRFRCWDSCIFSEFTLMASGENPRPTKRERIRQRLFHKFKYFPAKYKSFACVGCGRCLSKCPVNIDLIQTLSFLATESHGKSQKNPKRMVE